MHATRTQIRFLAAAALAGALALAGCQTGDSLAGPTWQWTSRPATDPAVTAAAAEPGDYTIEFRTDGTVKVQADCQSLSGTYDVAVPLDLTIDLAAPAGADCGAASLDRRFLDDLGRISSYATADGELQLFFAEEAGAMRFEILGS